MAWTAPRTWVTGEIVTSSQLNTHVRDNLLSVVPVGTVLPYAGLSLPSGSLYLFCDGSAVSRTTYSALFTAVGASYGAGDGSTTFNVPDLRGRVPVGKGSVSGLTNALGISDGLAESVRTPHHYHQWTRGLGNSVGGTLGNFAHFDNVGTPVNTSGNPSLIDTPAFLIVNFIIKALQ
jgi:hypothetical protein